MTDNNWKKIKLISEIKSKLLTIFVEQYLDGQKTIRVLESSKTRRDLNCRYSQ